MDELTTRRAAAAFQAEDAEHVIDLDERAEIVVPDGFQDEDSERSLIGRPPARLPRTRVP